MIVLENEKVEKVKKAMEDFIWLVSRFFRFDEGFIVCLFRWISGGQGLMPSTSPPVGEMRRSKTIRVWLKRKKSEVKDLRGLEP